MLLLTLPREVKWPLFLAWKTASRWADIASLTRTDFHLVEPTVVMVTFTDKTKGSHERPFRPDMLVLVEDHLVPEFWAYVQTVQNRLSHLTTQQLGKMMQSILHTHVTAQSIKRGALNLLTELVARDQLQPHFLPLLGKHVHQWSLPENTVRYITNKPALARIVGTQKATKLMPSL
jgi:hypothetical protein